MDTAVTTMQEARLQAQPGTIQEVVEMFLTQQQCAESSRELYRKTIRPFVGWVQRTGRAFGTLTRADILLYRAGLLDGTALEPKPAKPAAKKGRGRKKATEATEEARKLSSLTIASYLTAVRKFYSWLELNGIYKNIAKEIKDPDRANRFHREALSHEDAAALSREAASCDNLRDAAIISLLMHTGMRTIEVIRANVEDLQARGGGYILKVQGKGRTDKEDFVIISPKCYRALQAYLATRPAVRPSAPLFLCRSNKNQGGRLTTRSISRIVKDHLRKIGIDSREYTAHSLRHTFACDLLEATGYNYNYTQLAMRHRNPATTRVYTHHVEERQRLQQSSEILLDALY